MRTEEIFLLYSRPGFQGNRLLPWKATQKVSHLLPYGFNKFLKHSKNPKGSLIKKYSNLKYSQLWKFYCSKWYVRPIQRMERIIKRYLSCIYVCLDKCKTSQMTHKKLLMTTVRRGSKRLGMGMGGTPFSVFLLTLKFLVPVYILSIQWMN